MSQKKEVAEVPPDVLKFKKWYFAQKDPPQPTKEIKKWFANYPEEALKIYAFVETLLQKELKKGAQRRWAFSRPQWGFGSDSDAPHLTASWVGTRLGNLESYFAEHGDAKLKALVQQTISQREKNNEKKEKEKERKKMKAKPKSKDKDSKERIEANQEKKKSQERIEQKKSQDRIEQKKSQERIEQKKSQEKQHKKESKEQDWLTFIRARVNDDAKWLKGALTNLRALYVVKVKRYQKMIQEIQHEIQEAKIIELELEDQKPPKKVKKKKKEEEEEAEEKEEANTGQEKEEEEPTFVAPQFKPDLELDAESNHPKEPEKKKSADRKSQEKKSEKKKSQEKKTGGEGKTNSRDMDVKQLSLSGLLSAQKVVLAKQNELGLASAKTKLKENLLHAINDKTLGIASLTGSSRVGLRDHLCKLIFSLGQHVWRWTSNEFYNNMLLLGRPGSGKTTAARTIAFVLGHTGILARGKTIEVTKGNLVSSYINRSQFQTAKQVILALESVLFLDEAHLLAQSCKRVNEQGEPLGQASAVGASDNGDEATSQLMISMDKYRQLFVFIAAGYGPNMRCWIRTDEGLGRRFSMQERLGDFTTDDLIHQFFDRAKKTFGASVKFSSDDTAFISQRIRDYNDQRKFPNQGGDLGILFLKFVTAISESRRDWNHLSPAERQLMVADTFLAYDSYRS